jgi:hypothetical protein
VARLNTVREAGASGVAERVAVARADFRAMIAGDL